MLGVFIETLSPHCWIPLRIPCHLPCVTVETHRSHKYQIRCVYYSKPDHHTPVDELRPHEVCDYEGEDKTRDTKSRQIILTAMPEGADRTGHT